MCTGFFSRPCIFGPKAQKGKGRVCNRQGVFSNQVFKSYIVGALLGYMREKSYETVRARNCRAFSSRAHYANRWTWPWTDRSVHNAINTVIPHASLQVVYVRATCRETSRGSRAY